MFDPREVSPSQNAVRHDGASDQLGEAELAAEWVPAVGVDSERVELRDGAGVPDALGRGDPLARRRSRPGAGPVQLPAGLRRGARPRRTTARGRRARRAAPLRRRLTATPPAPAEPSNYSRILEIDDDECPSRVDGKRLGARIRSSDPTMQTSAADGPKV